MKIGVWVDRDFNPKAGGAFSYYNRLIEKLDEYDFNDDTELVFISQSVIEDKFNKDTLCISSIPKWIIKLVSKLPFLSSLIYRFELKYLKSFFVSNLIRNDIKLIYYLKQSTCHIPDFPFIATNWDIGHLSTYSFPEISSKKEYLRRSIYYENILPRAMMVFCESEASKKELLNFTNLGAHKIKIVPLFSGNVSSLSVNKDELEKTLSKYKLINNQFFFYPAQFWAHKNHFGLINAFSLFLKKHPNYKLVLCGSDKGNLNYIKQITNDLKIQDSVLFTGFVTNEELYSFYKCSSALVMASHFGPTNIPPIESMEIGCPVICSDIQGHREILENAGIYFNSFDINSIFKSMVILNEKRDEFHQKITQRNNNNLFNIDNSINQISKFLSEVVLIRNNWD